MNKNEMIASIAEEAGLSKAVARKALDSFMSSVMETLENDDEVVLRGFGRWYVEQRDARTGRNPRTGEEIQIAAKKVVKFKAGTSLSKAWTWKRKRGQVRLADLLP